MSTVAPGTTASLSSRTVPVTLADVSVCAASGAGMTRTERQAAASHPANDRTTDLIPTLLHRNHERLRKAALKGCATAAASGPPYPRPQDRDTRHSLGDGGQACFAA